MIRDPAGCVIWVVLFGAAVLTVLIMLQGGCAPCVCVPEPDPGVHQADAGSVELDDGGSGVSR